MIPVKRPRMWRGPLALKSDLLFVCLLQGRDNIVSFSFIFSPSFQPEVSRGVLWILSGTHWIQKPMLVCESTMEALLVVMITVSHTVLAGSPSLVIPP